MGRFYKTARPTFVDDIMYKAPHELMLNALQTQDKYLQKQKEELDAFDTMGDSLEYVDKDADKRNQILDEHRNKAHALAEKINSNPALYQNYIGDINRARKEFQKQISNGSLHNMDRTAKRRAKLFDALKKRMEKGEISQDAYQAAMDTADREYGGEGVNNYLESIHVYNKIDEAKYQKHLKDTITADGSLTTNTKPNGKGYMIKKGSSTTYISDEKIKEVVNTDPKTREWEREQLQTLSRQLAGGQFASEEEMIAEYNRRKKDFVDNTVAKLGFEKISNTDEWSTDSKWVADKNRAVSWARLKWDKEKYNKDLNSYEIEMKGQVQDLSNSRVNSIYGPGTIKTPIYPGMPGRPTDYVESNLTPEEKRKRLDNEKVVLNNKMKDKGISPQTFKEAMLTHSGRKKMQQQLGMTPEALLRQAKYNKDYSYRTVTSPIEDGKNPIENNKYQKFVTKTFNNMNANEKVDIRVIDASTGVEEEFLENTELGKAHEKGYVDGQYSAGTSKDLVPMNEGTKVGYMGHDGELIYMPDPKGRENEDGSIKQVPATKAYVLERGLGKTKQVKDFKFDPAKPLLNINIDKISESEKLDYGNGKIQGKKIPQKDVHISKMIDGKLKTIIISKKLDITPIEYKKQK